MIKGQLAVVLFAFVVFTAVPVYSQSQSVVKSDSVKILQKMNFTLSNVDGDDVNFKDLLGKGPVLLNFWALWCEPCKQEMKAFKVLVDKFKDEGVSMVAINEDQVRSLEKVRAYVSTQKLDFPVLTDPDGDIARDVFSMEQLPYSLILMPDGSVYKKHIGYTAGDEEGTDKEIVELLDQLAHKK